jgi:hypothetical protein
MAWLAALEAFLFLALWPIWSQRFPPMQDYPQHLLQAQMLRVHDNPAFDYNRNFEFHLRPYYAAFTLAVLLFSTVAPIEVAGKLALSLYPVLIAVVVYRLGRRSGARGAPWGALLFFPMAFNQQYFLGNVNFLLSLPLLVLALMDFEELLTGPAGAWPGLRQFLWQAVLFMAHPFTLLAYVGLAAVTAVAGWEKREGWTRKLLVMLGGAFLLLAASWIASGGASLPKLPAAGEIEWLSLRWTWEFFALMFNGMQWSRGAQPVPLVLWGGVFAILLAASVAGRKERGALLRRRAIVLVPVLIALCILPTRLGTFTFVNLRAAAIAYFLLALMAADLEFKGWQACALAVLLALTLADSIARQARIAAEVGQVVPVVERIPPNSRILPLIFEPGSPELEPFFFEPHLHDHDYYHLLVGGGFNPYFFPAPVLPVHYRKGAERPAPGEDNPWGFSWAAHASDYQYFLTRGAPESFKSSMARRCGEVAASGPWTLYERRRSVRPVSAACADSHAALTHSLQGCYNLNVNRRDWGCGKIAWRFFLLLTRGRES